MQILSRLKDRGPNVKIVAAISWGLFKLQSSDYKEHVISKNDWNNSMIITNTSIKLMKNWIKNDIVEKYSLSPDFDNRWRTGGSFEQIILEAKLDPQSIWDGILHFVFDRNKRINKLKRSIPDQ